jgi:hypothetical protein
MPWNVLSGRALSSKFDFRDDPTTISKVPEDALHDVYANFLNNADSFKFQESVESSLQIVHDISTENIGTLCISKQYSPLKIPLNTERYDGARQKSDLSAVILQDLGFNRHTGE